MMVSLGMTTSLQPIFNLAKEVTLTKDQVLIEQYAKATDFYLIKSGEVSFSLSMEGEELIVGSSDQDLTPIGWSGISMPNRYNTTVKVASNKVTAYHWYHDELIDFMEKNPRSCEEFLKLINSKARNLIKEAIHLLEEFAPALPQRAQIPQQEEFQSVNKTHEEDLVQFLRKSPFFEVFEEEPLTELAHFIKRRQYRTNDILYEQDADADGIYILALGKVSFSYHDQEQQFISFRQVNTPGFIVGWSGIIDLPNIISAHAVQESLIYFIPKEALDQILKKIPDFGITLYFRLLWLISHQLQAIRARLISAKFNHEIVAISNLIEQNSTKLELTSALHKVPHLLENKLTIRDGIETLKWLRDVGTTLEKNISALALDMLDEMDREQQFYTGLVKVYETVVKSPKNIKPEIIRKKSADAYREVFKNIPYKIFGWENLPEQPGNIFIYNHLRNHPFNTLPNQFQLTLDSHFISSLVLNEKYNDPGIRIVRIGRGAEYAHQEYYQRLGHIDVYTNESDPEAHTAEYREYQRQLFYQKACEYLGSGTNMIISPEGTSYGTEESPGPFKSGAFRLALGLEKEPSIVPIALANFDRRIRHNRFVCLILPPFKVSNYIDDPTDKKSMKTFLKEYQKKFRKYVEQAVELGSEK